MTADSNTNVEYQCPGEVGLISRSVHLARLAAGYAACESCLHRFDSDSLPQNIKRKINSPLTPNQNIFTNQGIRGAYLNQITRQSASYLIEHVLTMLEEERSETTDLPRIVLGHDARDCSPDIMMGVVATLKSWGSHITDLSKLSRPAFAYAVHHQRPDLGLYVTGGSSPSNWTGLDILNSEGHPWSTHDQLTELAAHLDQPVTRPRRSVGQYQMRYPGDAYQQLIAKAFAPIRQYRLAVASGCPLTLEHLIHLFEQSSCTLHPVNINFASRPELQQQRFTDEIQQRRVDLGVMIEPDGLALHIYDETGKRLSHENVERLLNANNSIPLVTDSQGRYWFQDQIPESDAILTLARVLKRLWYTRND